MSFCELSTFRTQQLFSYPITATFCGDKWTQQNLSSESFGLNWNHFLFPWLQQSVRCCLFKSLVSFLHDVFFPSCTENNKHPERPGEKKKQLVLSLINGASFTHAKLFYSSFFMKEPFIIERKKNKKLLLCEVYQGSRKLGIYADTK